MEKIFRVGVWGDISKSDTGEAAEGKYRAVTYLSLIEGPDAGFVLLYGFPRCSPKESSQPIRDRPFLSKFPIAYQMQASQWAIRAKVHMRRKSTAAPYSE